LFSQILSFDIWWNGLARLVLFVPKDTLFELIKVNETLNRLISHTVFLFELSLIVFKLLVKNFHLLVGIFLHQFGFNDLFQGRGIALKNLGVLWFDFFSIFKRMFVIVEKVVLGLCEHVFLDKVSDHFKNFEVCVFHLLQN
jgi:hypothetical protein